MKYALLEKDTNKLVGYYMEDIHYHTVEENISIDMVDNNIDLTLLSRDELNLLIYNFLKNTKIKYDGIHIGTITSTTISIIITKNILTFNINDCIAIDDDVWQEALKINANCYENGKFILKDFRTDKEIEIARVNSIKARAGEIITSKYPIPKQMNIHGDGGDIQVEMVAWIKKIRDISNKAEQDGTALADIIWE